MTWLSLGMGTRGWVSLGCSTGFLEGGEEEAATISTRKDAYKRVSQGGQELLLPQWTVVSCQASDNAPLHVAPASGSALMPSLFSPQISPKFEYLGGEP